MAKRRYEGVNPELRVEDVLKTIKRVPPPAVAPSTEPATAPSTAPFWKTDEFRGVVRNMQPTSPSPNVPHAFLYYDPDSRQLTNDKTDYRVYYNPWDRSLTLEQTKIPAVNATLQVIDPQFDISRLDEQIEPRTTVTPLEVEQVFPEARMLGEPIPGLPGTYRMSEEAERAIRAAYGIDEQAVRRKAIASVELEDVREELANIDNQILSASYPSPTKGAGPVVDLSDLSRRRAELKERERRLLQIIEETEESEQLADEAIDQFSEITGLKPREVMYVPGPDGTPIAVSGHDDSAIQRWWDATFVRPLRKFTEEAAQNPVWRVLGTGFRLLRRLPGHIWGYINNPLQAIPAGWQAASATEWWKTRNPPEELRVRYPLYWQQEMRARIDEEALQEQRDEVNFFAALSAFGAGWAEAFKTRNYEETLSFFEDTWLGFQRAAEDLREGRFPDTLEKPRFVTPELAHILSPDATPEEVRAWIETVDDDELFDLLGVSNPHEWRTKFYTNTVRWYEADKGIANELARVAAAQEKYRTDFETDEIWLYAVAKEAVERVKQYYREKWDISRSDWRYYDFTVTYTESWGPEDPEVLRDQITTALAYATLQKGDLLSPREIELIASRFTDPGTEFWGELLFDLSNLIPGAVMDKAILTPLKSLFRFAGKGVGKFVETVAPDFAAWAIRTFKTSSIISHSYKLRAKATETLGNIASVVRSPGDMREVLTKLVRGQLTPDEMAAYRLTARQVRHIMDPTNGVVIEAALDDPEDLVSLLDQAVSRVYDQVYRRHLGDGKSVEEATRLAEEYISNAKNIVPELTLQLQTAYLRAREVLPGTRLMPDTLVGRLAEALKIGSPPAKIEVLGSYKLPKRVIENAIRGFVQGVGFARNAWASMVLTARPGFTIINYFDTAFRAAVHGANMLDELRYLRELVPYWPEEIPGGFMRALTEDLGEDIAHLILSGEIEANFWTVFRRVAGDRWWLHPLKGLRGVNTAFETVFRMRTYVPLFVKDWNVVQRLIHEALLAEKILDDPIVKAIFESLSAVDTADTATINEILRTLVRQDLVDASYTRSLFFRTGWYDEVYKRLGSHAETKVYLRRVASSLMEEVQKGGLTPEGVQRAFQSVLDEIDALEREAVAVADATRGVDEGLNTKPDMDDMLGGADEVREIDPEVAGVQRSAKLKDGYLMYPEADGIRDDQHLLNAINKYSEGEYKSLDEVPVRVAEDALSVRRERKGITYVPPTKAQREAVEALEREVAEREAKLVEERLKAVTAPEPPESAVRAAPTPEIPSSRVVSEVPVGYHSDPTKLIDPDMVDPGYEYEGLYHVTTARDKVYDEGLKPRAETGRLGLGPGGSITDDGTRVSLTYNYAHAEELANGLHLAARVAQGKATVKEVVDWTLDRLEIGGALMEPPTNVQHVLNEALPIPRDDAGSWDWEILDDVIYELDDILNDKEKYELLQDLDDVISVLISDISSISGLEAPYLPVGLTAPYEAMAELDPNQIEILSIAVRDGAEVEHIPIEFEFRVKPEDLVVIRRPEEEFVSPVSIEYKAMKEAGADTLPPFVGGPLSHANYQWEITAGENMGRTGKLLDRRITPDGKVQYLVDISESADIVPFLDEDMEGLRVWVDAANIRGKLPEDIRAATSRMGHIINAVVEEGEQVDDFDEILRRYLRLSAEERRQLDPRLAKEFEGVADEVVQEMNYYTYWRRKFLTGYDASDFDESFILKQKAGSNYPDWYRRLTEKRWKDLRRAQAHAMAEKAFQILGAGEQPKYAYLVQIRSRTGEEAWEVITSDAAVKDMDELGALVKSLKGEDVEVADVVRSRRAKTRGGIYIEKPRNMSRALNKLAYEDGVEVVLDRALSEHVVIDTAMEGAGDVGYPVPPRPYVSYLVGSDMEDVREYATRFFTEEEAERFLKDLLPKAEEPPSQAAVQFAEDVEEAVEEGQDVPPVPEPTDEEIGPVEHQEPVPESKLEEYEAVFIEKTEDLPNEVQIHLRDELERAKARYKEAGEAEAKARARVNEFATRLTEAMARVADEATAKTLREALAYILQFDRDYTWMVTNTRFHEWLIEDYLFAGKRRYAAASLHNYIYWYEIKREFYEAMGKRFDEISDLIRAGNYDELARRFRDVEFPSVVDIFEDIGFEFQFDNAGNLVGMRWNKDLRFQLTDTYYTHSNGLYRFQQAVRRVGEEELTAPYTRILDAKPASGMPEEVAKAMPVPESEIARAEGVEAEELLKPTEPPEEVDEIWETIRAKPGYGGAYNEASARELAEMDEPLRGPSLNFIYGRVTDDDGAPVLRSFADFERFMKASISKAYEAGDTAKAQILEWRLQTVRQEYNALREAAGLASSSYKLPELETLPRDFQRLILEGTQAVDRAQVLRELTKDWMDDLIRRIEDGEPALVANLTAEQRETLERLRQRWTKLISEGLETVNYGGEFLGVKFPGAVHETNRFLLNYNEFTPFDQWMKNWVPFWMFPSRTIPMWLETMVLHPELAAFYLKYLGLSRRQAWRAGLTTRNGDQLPSARGYIRIPGTEYWVNLFGPISMRYAIPAYMPYSWEYEEDKDLTIFQKTTRYAWDILNMFGMSPNPLIPWILQQAGWLDANEDPLWPLIPQPGLVPPNFQRVIMSQLRKIVTTAPDKWDPDVGWKDFLIDREIVNIGLQRALATQDPEEQMRIYLQTVAALKNRNRRLVTGDRAGEYVSAEGAELYLEARDAVESREYNRRVFGYFTGIYPKQFTDAQVLLIQTRTEFNALAMALNSLVGMNMLELDPEAENRWDFWIRERYHSVEGYFSTLYNIISFVTGPDGKEVYDDERWEIIAQELTREVETHAYWDTWEVATNIRDKKLRALPAGATSEMRRAIYDEFYQTLATVETSGLMDAAQRPWFIGYKPPRLVWEDIESFFWHTALSALEPYDATRETYPEYLERREEFLNNEVPVIVKSSEVLWERLAKIEYLDPSVNKVDDIIKRLMDVASAEGYEEWRRSRMTVDDAIMDWWDRHRIQPFWDEAGDLDVNARELWFREHPAPTEEEIIGGVREEFPQFSDEEIYEAIHGRQIWDVKDRLEQETIEKRGEEMGKLEERLWDAINSIPPGKMDEVRKEFGLRGGDEDFLDEAFSKRVSFDDPDELRHQVLILERTLAYMGFGPLETLTDEELEERSQAKQEQNEFKEWVDKQTYPGFYEERQHYYSLSPSVRDDYLKAHPKFAAALERYDDLRAEWAKSHPVWADYYLNEGSTRRSSGGRRGSRTAEPSVAPRDQYLPLGKRATQDVTQLLRPGALGAAGPGGKLVWPPRLRKEAGPEIVEASREVASGKRSFTKTELDYLERLKKLWGGKYTAFIDEVIRMGAKEGESIVDVIKRRRLLTGH